MHLQPISCSTWKHTYHVTEKAPQQDFENTALSDPAKTSGFLTSGHKQVHYGNTHVSQITNN
jgi:hypothetical protein